MNDQHRAAPPSTRMARTQLAAAISAILAVGAQFHALPAAADEIEEIVVTATRRAQSLSDIPYNISAVGAADIANSGVTDLQGLTRMIPGLVAPDLGPRASNINDTLTIRGLNASSVNAESQEIAAPLVSTYVDETPLFANLKMTDIARVEVLRGPQGTLYGSGSVGGTVRMIHNEPDPTSTEFDVSTRASHTENAANPSEAIDFIGNLPISDTMAFRGSGGYEKLAGFTDALSVAVLGPNAQPVLANPSNPLTSPPEFTEQRGVDRSETWYARGALLWKPTDALKFTLSYQHQTDQSDGYSQTRPGYQNAQTLYMDQPGSFRTDLGALDLSYDGFRDRFVFFFLYEPVGIQPIRLDRAHRIPGCVLWKLSAHPIADHRYLDGQDVHRGAALRVEECRTLGLGHRCVFQRPQANARASRADSRFCELEPTPRNGQFPRSQSAGRLHRAKRDMPVSVVWRCHPVLQGRRPPLAQSVSRLELHAGSPRHLQRPRGLQ
jgi:outer membrane receptor protein involved in Fe transport